MEFQFGNVFEVHTVQPGQKTQRDKNRGNHGQYSHGVVELVRGNGQITVNQIAANVVEHRHQAGQTFKAVVQIIQSVIQPEIRLFKQRQITGFQLIGNTLVIIKNAPQLYQS